MGLGISSATYYPALAGFEADQASSKREESASIDACGQGRPGQPTACLRKSWLLASALLLVAGCGVIERGGLYQAPSRNVTRYESYPSSGGMSSAAPLPSQSQPTDITTMTTATPSYQDEQVVGYSAAPYEQGVDPLPSSAPQTYMDLSQEQAVQTFSSRDIGRQVRTQITKRAGTHPDWAGVLDKFYRTYGYQPIWYRGAWSKEAKVAEASLTKSWADGLPPRRYLPAEGINLTSARSLDAVARTELALTQGMILYLPELREGLTAQSQNGLQLLEAALASGNFETALERLRPQNEQFQGLRKAVLTMPMDDSAKRLIALNMHRFRNPQEQVGGRRVRVNLPGYNLDVFDGQRHVMSMPVIIGQPDRATPILQDRIVNLKFSPDWSVPTVAAGEDLLPLLKHDAKALVEKMGLQAFRRGKAVDPLSVDWNRYSASSLPYTFRQRPGPKNAMGGVRFSMTNPQDIYLHDTPERELFSENVRMISSGCVRVADAEKLASWMLNREAGWPRSKVKRAMDAGKTHIQILKTPVAVDLVYYTALIDPKGELKLYADVYGKDAALAAQLGI